MGDKTPVLKIGLPLGAPGTDVADPTTRALYQDSRDSIVQILGSGPTGSGSGSGFVVKDDRTVVTDHHVVKGRTTVDVVDSKRGKVWKAKVKDIDDLNDLAVLEIVGEKPTNLKPLALGSSQGLVADTSNYALGHPLGSELSYISPGYFVKRVIESDLPARRDPKDFLTTPLEQADLQKFLSRPLLWNRIHVEHGSSGGPALSADGKVIGVTDYAQDRDGIFTPVEAVSALINRDTPKFKFAYSYQASPTAHWVEDLGLLEKGALTGAAAYGTRLAYRSPTVATVAGIYGLTSLSADTSSFIKSTNWRDTLKYGVATTGDIAITAGAAVRLGQKIPSACKFLLKAGPFGKAAVVAGIVLKIGSEFVHSNLELHDISRTDGSLRAPFDIYDLPLTPEARAKTEAWKSDR